MSRDTIKKNLMSPQRRLANKKTILAALFFSFLCVPKELNGFHIAKVAVSSRKGELLLSKTNVDDSSLLQCWSKRVHVAGIRASSELAVALFLLYGSTICAPVQAATTEPAEIRGIKLNPLNSLTFNYRGADFSGLDASTLGSQPTISYKDFLERLSLGEVEYVEFLAPNGDEAYVTLKAKVGDKEKPAPIRIGAGYPIEQSDGWSSPAFAIRSVKDKGVPYKFIVPGLEKYK